MVCSSNKNLSKIHDDCISLLSQISNLLAKLATYNSDDRVVALLHDRMVHSQLPCRTAVIILPTLSFCYHIYCYDYHYY